MRESGRPASTALVFAVLAAAACGLITASNTDSDTSSRSDDRLSASSASLEEHQMASLSDEATTGSTVQGRPKVPASAAHHYAAVALLHPIPVSMSQVFLMGQR